MEQDKSLLDELVGKKVLIKNQFGIGTKAGMLPGEYKGVLLSYDDKFIKLEYEVRKFVNNNSMLGKSVILVNLVYVITVEEYQETE